MNYHRIHPTTQLGEGGHTIVAASLESFWDELKAVIDSCDADEPLFRGQRDANWPLECTFVRNAKAAILAELGETALRAEVQASAQYYFLMLDRYLLKNRVLVKPSGDLLKASLQHGLEPIFELMRRLQQHPEEDLAPPELRGTNFLDFTHRLDVALFFAYHGGSDDAASALYVVDQVHMGKVLHQRYAHVLELLDVKYRSFDVNSAPPIEALPLMISPPVQNTYPRIKAQAPVYLCQMDFRWPLERIWQQVQEETGNQVYAKLVIPSGSRDKLETYLRSRGLSEATVVPA